MHDSEFCITALLELIFIDIVGTMLSYGFYLVV
jgi:hypothetical protein